MIRREELRRVLLRVLDEEPQPIRLCAAKAVQLAKVALHRCQEAAATRPCTSCRKAESKLLISGYLGHSLQRKRRRRVGRGTSEPKSLMATAPVGRTLIGL